MIDVFSEIEKKELLEIKNNLNNHDLFLEINTMEKLHKFMTIHVYAVWDFMSLLKSIQKEVTCVDIPWTPKENENNARVINEIVLSEESELLNNGESISHFSLYLKAMEEVGINTFEIKNFINDLKKFNSFSHALKHTYIPDSAKKFMIKTFEVVEGDDILKKVTYFLYGREKIIPEMFLRIKNGDFFYKNKIKFFNEYLERHIELDYDSHAPLAEKLLIKV